MSEEKWEERTMRFHWGAGLKPEEAIGRGKDRFARAADAFSRLGYGGGAIRALDYWEELPDPPSRQIGERDG